LEVTLPNDWAPRSYQLPLWQALESGVKRACCVWHRRAGKDLTFLNFIAWVSQMRVGVYWHVAPYQAQARKIIWEGIKSDGKRYLDAFPGWRTPTRKGNFVTRIRDDSMCVWLANGSLVQLIGADNPDSIVGPNPIGIAMTEYSLQDPSFWNLARPILMENDGWAGFIFTPRGRNHGYRLWERARRSDRWFSQMLTVEDTARMAVEAGEPIPVTEERIQEEREDDMEESLIQQEFYCSFDAPIEGSFFGDLMSQLLKDKHIGKVPHEPELPVFTAWDIGKGDHNAIIFAQQHGREVRIIDFEHGQAKGGLHDFVKVVRDKPYVYEDHYAPHDIGVQDYSSEGGRTRYEVAKALGIKFRMVRKMGFADGIQASKALLPRCWIDEDKCEHLITALREYTKVKQPDGSFSDTPKKDWTNHPCDAFRYLAVGLRREKKKEAPRQPQVAVV
jgi:hypothetical protein